MFDIKDRTRVFVVRLVKFVDALPKGLSSEVIGRQVMRSATSIGANVHEAQASPTRKDFTLLMSHALKSANETEYWLAVLADSKNISSEELVWLSNECSQLCKILGSSVSSLKRPAQHRSQSDSTIIH